MFKPEAFSLLYFVSIDLQYYYLLTVKSVYLFINVFLYLGLCLTAPLKAT